MVRRVRVHDAHRSHAWVKSIPARTPAEYESRAAFRVMRPGRPRRHSDRYPTRCDHKVRVTTTPAAPHGTGRARDCSGSTSLQVVERAVSLTSKSPNQMLPQMRTSPAR